MLLALRVVQKEDEEGGYIQIAKRHSPTCGTLIGQVSFEDRDEKRYLLNLLTEGRATADVREGTEPFPSKCPVCGEEGSVRVE